MDYEDVELADFDQDDSSPDNEPEKPGRSRRALIIGVVLVVVLLVGSVMAFSGSGDEKAPVRKEPKPSQYPGQDTKEQPGKGKKAVNEPTEPGNRNPGDPARPVDPNDPVSNQNPDQGTTDDYDYDYEPSKPKPVVRQLSPIEKSKQVLKRGAPRKYMDRPRWFAYWLSKQIKYPVKVGTVTSPDFVSVNIYDHVGSVSLRMIEKGNSYPSISLVKVWDIPHP